MVASRRDFEEKFDIRGLFFMAVVTLVKKYTRRRIGNWLASPNRLFCSEFVETVLKATGKLPYNTWVPGESSPKQVYEACEHESKSDKATQRFRKVSPDELTAWLEEVGVDTSKIPPTLIAASL